MSQLFGVQICQIRDLSKSEYAALRTLCWLSKNLYNVGLYAIRQHFFSTREYLSYESNYHACKENENYKLLNTDAAQQTLKKVDENFQSFFGARANGVATARIPGYLEKDGLFEIAFPRVKVQADGTFFLPMSPAFKKQHGKVKLTFPKNLIGKKVCEVKIVPKCGGLYFEAQYTYKIEAQKPKLDKKHALAIDFGVDNLMACVTTRGASFLVDGKALKSKNRWYNKRMAGLQYQNAYHGVEHYTNKQLLLLQYRNNFTRDYANKSARYVIDHCLENNIGKIIAGYNKGWKDSINIGAENNQKFVQIPHGQLKDKLKALCERYGIVFVEQEESYTSQASFIDNDAIPTYVKGSNAKHKFSGRRVKRGLFKAKEKRFVNADSQGSANILRKSGHAFDAEVVKKALLQNPKRVRIV